MARRMGSSAGFCSACRLFVASVVTSSARAKSLERLRIFCDFVGCMNELVARGCGATEEMQVLRLRRPSAPPPLGVTNLVEWDEEHFAASERVVLFILLPC